MSRMGREFCWVLLGAGLLFAGWCFVPESAVTHAPRSLNKPPRPRTPTRRVTLDPPGAVPLPLPQHG